MTQLFFFFQAFSENLGVHNYTNKLAWGVLGIFLQKRLPSILIFYNMDRWPTRYLSYFSIWNTVPYFYFFAIWKTVPYFSYSTIRDAFPYFTVLQYRYAKLFLFYYSTKVSAVPYLSHFTNIKCSLILYVCFQCHLLISNLCYGIFSAFFLISNDCNM